MKGVAQRLGRLWSARSDEALSRETLARRMLLGSSFVAAILAGLFVDLLALMTGIWMACVTVAAWATSPLWLDMQRGVRAFNYGTLLQLIVIVVLGNNAVNHPSLALPCAAAGLILSYTAFRNPPRALTNHGNDLAG